MMSHFRFFIENTRHSAPLQIREYYPIRSEEEFYDAFSPLISFLSKYNNTSLYFINTKEAKSELLKIENYYYILFDHNQASYIMDLIELFFIAESNKDIIVFIDLYFKRENNYNEKHRRIINLLLKNCEEKRHLHGIGNINEFGKNLSLIKRLIDHFIVFHEFGHMVAIYSKEFPTESFKNFDMEQMVNRVYDLFLSHYANLIHKQPDSPITTYFYTFKDQFIKKDNDGKFFKIKNDKNELSYLFSSNKQYLIRELGADLISLRMIMETFQDELKKNDEMDLTFFTGLSLIFKSILFYKELFLISDYFSYGKVNGNSVLDKFRDLLFTEAVSLEMLLTLGEDKFVECNNSLNSINISYHNRFGYTINLLKDTFKSIL